MIILVIGGKMKIFPLYRKKNKKYKIKTQYKKYKTQTQ